jgi:hypothetical protein
MYCHACGKDFDVDMNMQADGNHVFNCPHCQHEHCRVVKNGFITSDRWDTRNGNIGAVFYAATTTITNTATTATFSFAGDSWATTSTVTAYY